MLGSLRGRKMYGLFYPETGEYFACVETDGHGLGLPRKTIPAGLYAKRKVRDWMSKIAMIGNYFEELKQTTMKHGYMHDSKRPSVEFYERFDRLVLMLPVSRSQGLGRFME